MTRFSRAKRLHEPLLHLVFVRAAIAHAPADFLRRLRRVIAIDAIARRKVCLDLLVGPGGFELATRSAELTMFLPRPRIRSIVPASTSET